MNDKDKNQRNAVKKGNEPWLKRNYMNIPAEDAKARDEEVRAKEAEERRKFWEAMLSWDPCEKDSTIPKVYINGVHIYHLFITLPLLSVGLIVFALVGMATLRFFGLS